MYGALQKIFERLHAFADGKREDFISLHPFTIAFYGAGRLVEHELISELERLSTNSKFRADVFSLYMSARNDERRSLETDLAKRPEDRATKLYYQFSMEVLRPKLLALDFKAMIALMNEEFIEYTGYLEIFSKIYAEFHSDSGEKFIADNYCWYQIGMMLYCRWREEKNREIYINQSMSHKVSDEYAKVGIDVSSVDLQFSKYKILSLAPDLIISNEKDSQTMYHTKIKRHFWINVPRRLLLALEALKAQNLYEQIAFNITMITDTIPMMEDMERGEKLKINLAAMPDVSRFYSSDSFNDNLTIVHDRAWNSLAFEELRSDYYIAEDRVVTQVVHLEYKVLDGRTYITHLDHELIAYTLDEYEKRLIDLTQKGSAGKVKSFKIDSALIPFDFKYEGDWFLLIVLDSYFINYEIIQEVFEGLA